MSDDLGRPLHDYQGEEVQLGPLTFEVLRDGIGVSTEHEYCGLLDNFYGHHWEELKATAARLR